MSQGPRGDPPGLRVAPAPTRGTLPSMLRTILIACLVASPLGCSKSGPATTAPATTTPAPDPLAGKPVVPNVEAQTGDVTICPYSGRKFVVADDSPRFEYEGKTYVLCAEQALREVQKDPAKYLAGFEG